MSHDDAFAAFREKRDAERATTVKVTWRRATWGDEQGWSGLGPGGRLLYVAPAPLGTDRGFYFGDVTAEGLRTIRGTMPGPIQAKRGAERWLRRQLGDES